MTNNGCIVDNETMIEFIKTHYKIYFFFVVIAGNYISMNNGNNGCIVGNETMIEFIKTHYKIYF